MDVDKTKFFFKMITMLWQKYAILTSNIIVAQLEFYLQYNFSPAFASPPLKFKAFINLSCYM